jgi:Uncharacterized conserved protein
MLTFKPVEISDKDTIQSVFNNNTYRNCDFSFSNIFSWRHYYETTFAVEDQCLYIRFQGHDDEPGYLFPLGEKDIKHRIERLRRDAEKRGDAFCLYAVTERMMEEIEQAFPGEFVYRQDRAWFEYLYSSVDLITLTGKKLQNKRNHINKFKCTYQWEYLPITRDIIPDCLKLYERWCEENGDCKSDNSLMQEGIATQSAFDNYEKLGLIGGALRIDGEILAYSYGQPLTRDTFGVHAEKSLHTVDGGFTMINQQFAEHNCKDYLYINREEDLGLESLRKAKMSYHPAMLLGKGYVELVK